MLVGKPGYERGGERGSSERVGGVGSSERGGGDDSNERGDDGDRLFSRGDGDERGVFYGVLLCGKRGFVCGVLPVPWWEVQTRPKEETTTKFFCSS